MDHSFMLYLAHHSSTRLLISFDPFSDFQRKHYKSLNERGETLKNQLIKRPNPQGKGLVNVLQEIDSRQLLARADHKKCVSETLRDYAISRLILCAKFNFKPVVSKQYYLYIKGGALKLSLISPSEWRNNKFGLYVCQCLLGESMLWSISKKTDQLDAIDAISLAFSRLRSSLLSDLFLDQPLVSTLPFHDERLPFHQRVLANALASQVTRQIPHELSKSLQQLVQQHNNTFNQIPFLGTYD